MPGRLGKVLILGVGLRFAGQRIETMLTIGDVFGIVAALTGLFLTSWAMTIAAALLFPNHSDRAGDALREETRKTFGYGLCILLVVGFIGFAFVAGPNPIGKLAGWAVLLCLLAMSSIGLAGTSKIVASRIQSLDPALAAFPALVRGAAFLIGGAMLPILGWFAFGPLLLAAALGAGAKSVIRRPPAQEAPEIAGAI